MGKTYYSVGWDKKKQHIFTTLAEAQEYAMANGYPPIHKLRKPPTPSTNTVKEKKHEV